MTQTVSLGDICIKVTSGGTPSTKHPEYYNGDIPWLRTQEVNFEYIHNTEKTITDSGLKNSSAKLIPENSVIIAMYGVTAGKSAINKIPLTTNQACCNLIIDHKKADYRYVYYHLLNNYEKLKNAATGAAQQNLGAKQIAAMQIVLPPLDEQTKIADFLSSIDEKIELNRKMNDTLEQMGQALFCDYFITNPDAVGWDVVRLGSIAEVTDYVANGSFASLKENVALFDQEEYALYIRTTDYKNGFKNSLKYVDRKSYDFLKKSSLDGSEFIISNVGDVGTVFKAPVWLKKPMTLASNVVLVRDSTYNNYLYLYFRGKEGQFALSNITAGSAQPKFNKTEFRNLKIKKPDDKSLTKFNESYNLISERLVVSNSEIQALTTLRDTLLPRLISGKIKI